MTRLEYVQGPVTEGTKLRLNAQKPVKQGFPKDAGQNRLADCICCCPSPPTLYLHIQCAHSLGTCEDDCVGTSSPGTPGQHDPGILGTDPSGSNCEDWTMSTAIGSLVCSQGIGQEDHSFDIDSELHCYRENKFRLDLCAGASSDIETDTCPDDKLLNMEPIDQRVCEDWNGEIDETGDFALDFGVHTFGTTCGTDCGFHVFINQNPNDTSLPPVFSALPTDDIHGFFAA